MAGLVLIAGIIYWNTFSIRVKINFKDTNPVDQITDISVIAGSDKDYIATLKAGESTTTRLRLNDEDDRQLTLLYTLNGEKKYWDGPKIESKRYNIEINNNAQGLIDYK